MATLTDSQRMNFLTALRLGNSVSKACELSGVARRTAYYWRSEDEGFSDAWKEAVEASVEELEDKVRARALDDSDPKAHLMLMFLLKKHKPEYRDNYRSEVKITQESVSEFSFSPQEVSKALAILKAAQDAGPQAAEES